MYNDALNNNNIQQRNCYPHHYHPYYSSLYHHYLFTNDSNVGYYYYTSPTPLSTTTFILDSSSGINNNGLVRSYSPMMYSTSNNESYAYQQQQQQQQSINPTLLFDGNHYHHQYHASGVWNNTEASADKKNLMNSNGNLDNNTVLPPYNDTPVNIQLYAHSKNVLADSNSSTGSSCCTFPTTVTVDGINDNSDELLPGCFSASSPNEATITKGEGSSMGVNKKSSSSSTAISLYANKKKQQSIPPVTILRSQAIPGFQKSHRTKTSYDPKTSYRLNVLFFETFGKGRKPTKIQRSKIQHKTGINSRRLTYWLSNHKRRFNSELKAFHRLVLENKIDGYDDFIEYCKKNDVPELRRDGENDEYNNDSMEMHQHQSTGSGPSSNDVDNEENDIETGIVDDDDDNETNSNSSLLSDNAYANSKKDTYDTQQ